MPDKLDGGIYVRARMQNANRWPQAGQLGMGHFIRAYAMRDQKAQCEPPRGKEEGAHEVNSDPALETNESRLGISWKGPSGRLFVQVRAAEGYLGAPGAASWGLEILLISPSCGPFILVPLFDRCHCLRNIRVWFCRPFAELIGVSGK